MPSAYHHLKHTIFGRPLASERLEHERLNKKTALAVLSSDAISSVAYATDDSASLAKTGSAIRLGSNVSPNRSERMARPRTTRFPIPARLATAEHRRPSGGRHAPGAPDVAP